MCDKEFKELVKIPSVYKFCIQFPYFPAFFCLQTNMVRLSKPYDCFSVLCVIQ